MFVLSTLLPLVSLLYNLDNCSIDIPSLSGLANVPVVTADSLLFAHRKFISTLYLLLYY